ncbi:MAG: hypothetical protein QF473_00485 [Planctomycetota bacterium]|nr:hypothetical protein [Planctomycetota bacterium]
MALGNIEAPETLFRVDPAEEQSSLSDHEAQPPPTIFDVPETVDEILDSDDEQETEPAQAFFDESLQATQQGSFPSTIVTNEPSTQSASWPALLRDAEYKLGVIRAKLDLIRQLAIRAANGAINPEELEGIIKEAQALIQEVIDINESILLNQHAPDQPFNPKADTPPVTPQLFPDFFTREGSFVLATSGVTYLPIRNMDLTTQTGSLDAIKSVGEMIGIISDVQFSMIRAQAERRERGEARVTEQTAAAHGDRVTDTGIQVIEDMINVPWPYAGAQANLNPQHVVSIFRGGNAIGDVGIRYETGRESYANVGAL